MFFFGRPLYHIFIAHICQFLHRPPNGRRQNVGPKKYPTHAVAAASENNFRLNLMFLTSDAQSLALHRCVLRYILLSSNRNFPSRLTAHSEL